ncbi:MAG: NAD(P)/FAD-dependent oxidoreductase [Halothiobacillaceae bacterium]
MIVHLHNGPDMQPAQQHGLRIAVIGSGISGLAAAWLLGQHHRVTVLEQDTRLGGHTHTVEVRDRGSALPVDTGFIVYNEPNYPLLTGLFEFLGIETQETEMSFSVSMDDGRLEYGGANLNTLFSQRRNLLRPSFLRMVRDILRFNRLGKATLARETPGTEDQTLDDFLTKHGFCDQLARNYLLPMAAAIWSCPTDTMRRFPARSFLRFFENHGLLNIEDRPQWRTVVGGSWRYVERLRTSGRFDYRLNCPVSRVVRDGSGVYLPELDERFDALILAAHADQSLAMLDKPDELEQSVLGAFGFQDNIAYLHNDATLMPRHQRVWSSWNYYGRSGADGQEAVAVTYWMNRLQNLDSAKPWLVTLNPPVPPAEALTARKIRYSHPVFDPAAMAAQQRLKQIQGRNHCWYCGAWTGYGFHEDGLRSAVAVARDFGALPPWESE